MHDAAGAGVSGVTVSMAGVDAVTGADGRASVAVPVAEGDNSWPVRAIAPNLTLDSYGPRRPPAQRVAKPGVATLEATAAFTAVSPHRLRVHKQGDDTAYLPVAGARFEIAGHELVVGDDAMTGPVDLPPGRYTVTETAAPPGYAVAGPWEVDLTSGDAVLEAVDHAQPGTLSLAKVDSVSGAPLAGAVFHLAFDADHNGVFETALPAVTAPAERPGLLPGDYRLTEAAPPPGYRVADPVTFTVAPGATTPVRVADSPVPVAPAPPTSTPTTTTTAPPRPPVASPPSPPPVVQAQTLPVTGSAVGREAAVGGGLCVLGLPLALAGSPRRRIRRRLRAFAVQ